MTVYSPAEDTYLLASVIPDDLEDKNCLEIGTGSGYIAEEIAEKNPEKVTAVDINPEAVKEASERLKDFENTEIFVSDLFDSVKGKFDVIVFNPPYLPGEASNIGDEEIWSGGEKGGEVTERFLENVESYLTEDGKVFFIVSSLSDLDLDEFEVLSSKKLWFETIYAVGFQ